MAKRRVKKASKKVTDGTKALAIVKSIQKKIEYKHERKHEEELGLDEGGLVISLLSAIPQGTDETDRTGDYISPTRVSGRLILEPQDTANTASSQIFQGGIARLVLLRGNHENGLIPVPSSVEDAARGILDNSDGSPLIIARKEDDNIRDTKFLYDKTFVLNVSKNRHVFDWNFKLQGNTQYTKSTSSGASPIENGGLYLMAIADIPETIQMSYDLRTTYTDL